MTGWLGPDEWQAVALSLKVSFWATVLSLPVGLLCDQYGGRIVFFLVMLFAAVPLFLVGSANGYGAFFLAGLGFQIGNGRTIRVASGFGSGAVLAIAFGKLRASGASRAAAKWAAARR